MKRSSPSLNGDCLQTIILIDGYLLKKKKTNKQKAISETSGQQPNGNPQSNQKYIEDLVDHK